MVALPRSAAAPPVPASLLPWLPSDAGVAAPMRRLPASRVKSRAAERTTHIMPLTSCSRTVLQSRRVEERYVHQWTRRGVKVSTAGSPEVVTVCQSCLARNRLHLQSSGSEAARRASARCRCTDMLPQCPFELNHLWRCLRRPSTGWSRTQRRQKALPKSRMTHWSANMTG